MKAISLFAGIGGFDLALERCGHTVTDQVEIDSHARDTLARHFPNARLHEDINDFTGADSDIVVGGFPCQDYSVAGDRSGLVGDRGALWWQMHRVIYESRPTWVIGENVPGLVSSNDGRDFQTIIRSLVVLGYEENPDPKYSLSARAASGILRRAEKRGKTLPPLLRDALTSVAQRRELSDH
jgi:DNA (cytosine-5)-methyltransferase 1